MINEMKDRAWTGNRRFGKKHDEDNLCKWGGVGEVGSRVRTRQTDSSGEKEEITVVSQETKGRKKKQTFLLSPLLSVTVLAVTAYFHVEAWRRAQLTLMEVSRIFPVILQSFNLMRFLIRCNVTPGLWVIFLVLNNWNFKPTGFWASVPSSRHFYWQLRQVGLHCSSNCGGCFKSMA